MPNRSIVAATLLLLTGGSSFAHVTLTEPSALPGARYIAHFHVGHGCTGSPTIALTIAIPEGVSDVAPQPMPGWTLQIEHAGGRVESVTWSGGLLAADQPGEFAISMMLPSVPGTLVFPAAQACVKGIEQWSEPPAADGHRLKNPAPTLNVSQTPAAAPNNSMPGMKM